MNVSLSFIRLFFLMMCILFLTTYTTTMTSNGFNFTNTVIGVALGCAFGFGLMGTETLFKKFNLRAFNIATLGLFIGYLMGQAILLIFNAVLDVSVMPITSETATLIRIGIFLFAAYMGMVMTARASEEIYVSIPFFKFKPTNQKKKDILVDISALGDCRLIDLASSGLLDNHLVIPRFILKELNQMIDCPDESQRNRARRCLEVVKKLESVPTLDLRYSDSDFPEIKDVLTKLIRLARVSDFIIITSDMSRVQQASVEGVRILNLHLLSNALKPITQSGEYISIKIQRIGKEPRQGVGYLEDGTMVVVNGGAEFLGDSVKAQVLSVKHTSSGRMIFCNASSEFDLDDEDLMIRNHMDSHEMAMKHFTTV